MRTLILIFLGCVLSPTWHGMAWADLAGKDELDGLSSEDIMRIGEIPSETFAPASIGAALASTKIKDARGPPGRNLYKMGDMFLTKDQFDSMYGNNSQGYNGVTNPQLRWTNAIVPYVISGEMRKYESVIYGAMKEWQENTCIRFEKYSSSLARQVGHKNRIKIFNGQGCNSMVGMMRWGEQKVSLEHGGCTMHSTALHELGHAIGLHHEQDRPDRDRYLKIIWANIPKKWQFAFGIKSGVSPFGMKLDYCSIMEYDTFSFSTNGRPTIITRDPDYQFTIGNLNHGTFEDWKIINLMYKCNQLRNCAANPQCKSPCYVNHKCKCECPTGQCCKNKRPCDNYDSNCDYWAKMGKCRANAWYMRQNCPKACGICADYEKLRGDPIKTKCNNEDVSGGGDNGGGGDGGGGDGGGGDGGGNGGSTEGPNCIDKDDSCQAWAEQGECEKNSKYMYPNCPKACGFCKNCSNQDEKCEEWASRTPSECKKNPWFMFPNCNKACGLCK